MFSSGWLFTSESLVTEFNFETMELVFVKTEPNWI
nr:MAG TPA: hypothetical protein [Caudoviricetes sp.]